MFNILLNEEIHWYSLNSVTLELKRWILKSTHKKLIISLSYPPFFFAAILMAKSWVIFYFSFYLIWPLLINNHFILIQVTFNSVQFSHSVVSDSLRRHELQHTRPPYLSPTPGIYSNSCPSSRWCHPAISSSVTPFPPAPNPSQHQGLFQLVNSSCEVAKVLDVQLQHQSFQWTPRTELH